MEERRYNVDVGSVQSYSQFLEHYTLKGIGYSMIPGLHRWDIYPPIPDDEDRARRMLLALDLIYKVPLQKLAMYDMQKEHENKLMWGK